MSAPAFIPTSLAALPLLLLLLLLVGVPSLPLLLCVLLLVGLVGSEVLASAAAARAADPPAESAALTAVVAAVRRDLHARQAQDYKSVCVCVFKGFGVLSPGFDCDGGSSLA